MLIGNRIYDLVNYMTSEMTLKVNGVRPIIRNLGAHYP